MAIVLIGPPCSGKTTVGRLAAARLGRALVDGDAASAEYYSQVGWTVGRLRALAREIGYPAAHRAWEEALIHALEQLVARGRDAVLALGAGHSHMTRLDFQERAARALAGCELVIHLRPTPDPAESVRVLRERCIADGRGDWIRDGTDMLGLWIADGLDLRFATHVLYTAGESPEQTADRLVRLAGPTDL
jgi:shikimate kinase